MPRYARVALEGTMTTNLKCQLLKAQAKVGEGNEAIARKRILIQLREANGQDCSAMRQELQSLMVRQRMYVIELKRLIALATPTETTPSEVTRIAAHLASRTARAGQRGRSA